MSVGMLSNFQGGSEQKAALTISPEKFMLRWTADQTRADIAKLSFVPYTSHEVILCPSLVIPELQHTYQRVASPAP